MSFFSFAFLENAISFQGYLKYIAIFASLGALLVVTSLYLRNRLETKYRDLSIIFLLLIILLLGVQYHQYQQNEVYVADTSRVVTFLNSVKVWGSDNICIRKKKKFGGKKLVGAPVCRALAFLGGKFMQKSKMVGIGGKWSKIGFYFA